MRNKIIVSIMVVIMLATPGFVTAQDTAFSKNTPPANAAQALEETKALPGILPYQYPKAELIPPYRFADSAPQKTDTKSDVSFSSNFQTVVIGHPVTFAAKASIGNLSDYQWSFPGGTPAVSTDSNPIVTYANPGYYNVSLTVMTQNGPVALNKTEYIHAIMEAEFKNLTGKENDRWYFSKQNVFSFEDTGGLPDVSLAPFFEYIQEGNATISNGDGNLLFYGHPTTLYNRHHQVMQNGDNLAGGDSSTQGLLIIPQPSKFVNGINQNHGKYYIFTTEHRQQYQRFELFESHRLKQPFRPAPDNLAYFHYS